MRQRTAILVGACLATLSACTAKTDETAAASASAVAASAPVAADPAQVRSAIDAANQQAVTGMLANDPVAATANYSDDAVAMHPGMAAMRGRAAIQEGIKGMMGSMSVTAAKFTTEDVMVSGDVAVEMGTYAMTLQPKGGKAMDDKGKYLTIWKRQGDGSWKIVRDINNSDAAPGGAQ
jgi:uncharacterized protein (TIGR02246 family)